MKTTQNGTRYPILDTIRGLALVSMILYHATWDLVYAFGVKLTWFPSDASHVWQQSICQTFILLSGFCFSLGKRRLKRGFMVFGASILISVVTCILMPKSRILFGVLTLIGSSMLIMVPLSKFLEKMNAYWGAAVSLLLFCLTKNVDGRVISFGSLDILQLPKGGGSYVTAFFGFPQSGFYSADYFPLIPWFFLFAAGFFIYRVFVRHSLLQRLPRLSLPVFTWFGKHSLIIYLAHQPLIYGVLYLIFNVILKGA